MRWFWFLLAALAAHAQLRLAQTIPLAGVEGRIDHLAADASGGRLFVAALGHGTMEVIDLSAGRPVRSLRGFAEPQGIAWLPDLGRLYVASGGDGRCAIFDGALAPAGEAAFGADADNVRYDPSAKRVWVGYGEGALGEVDATAGKRLGNVPLAAHPESFQLERHGARIFVNVPKAGHVAVVDRRRREVTARWATPGAAANYPMALDEEHGRLLVGCRKPPQVLVYDTANGQVTARFGCPGDTDDLFYDAARRRVYVSGGEGTVGVFRQAAADRYEPLDTVRTAAGARTSLFVPALGRLYVAVPHRGAQGAAILVYQTE